MCTGQGRAAGARRVGAGGWLGEVDLFSETGAGGEECDEEERADDGDVEIHFAGFKGKAVVSEPYRLLAEVVGVAAVCPQSFSHEAHLSHVTRHTSHVTRHTSQTPP